MKVICISGKARHGKDTTAKHLSEILQEKGYKVLITHYADLLKFICKNMFSWDGQKNEEGRHILQYVGTDIIKKQQPNFWVDFIIQILQLFPDTWDYVLIPDCRFPNEITRMKEAGLHTIHVRVIRPFFENGLTEEAKKHISETALDQFKYDLLLLNSGDDSYKNTIKEIFNYINLEEKKEMNKMNKVILYSTGCPQCNVLKKKLIAKGIPFEENTDKEQMLSLNFVRVPVLEVNGNRMDFTAANKWLNEQEG